MTTTSTALSTLIRIPTDAPGYDWDQWELDGETVSQGDLTFHELGVTYQGRYFADDGSTIQFDEMVF